MFKRLKFRTIMKPCYYFSENKKVRKSQKVQSVYKHVLPDLRSIGNEMEGHVSTTG